MFQWLDRIRRTFLFTDNRYKTLTRSQREAFADLVALAMVVDKHVARSEREAVARALEAFDWPSDHPSEHFINQSVQRAWQLLGGATPDANILAYCRELRDRLVDDWLIESAYIAVLEVIESDEEIDEMELRLIAYMKEAFGIDEAQARELEARFRAGGQDD